MNPLDSIIIRYALHTCESIFFSKPPRILIQNFSCLTLFDCLITVYYIRKRENSKADPKETLKYLQVHSPIYPFGRLKVLPGENILSE